MNAIRQFFSPPPWHHPVAFLIAAAFWASLVGFYFAGLPLWRAAVCSVAVCG